MLKEDLSEVYKYKIELHAHSCPVSACCNCSMERMLELYSAKNIDAICLTNHFFRDSWMYKDKTKDDFISCYISDYEKLKEMAKPYGITVYLGCEIQFAENFNHYLIYGVNKEILEEAYDYLDYDLKTYRENVKLKDSLFIQAHPFRDSIIPVRPKYVDGYETFNLHTGHNNRTASSAQYAKENNADICIGGSDFHHDEKYHAGSCLMLGKTLPKDSFELAKLIKSKDYIFLIGDNHIVIP